MESSHGLGFVEAGSRVDDVVRTHLRMGDNVVDDQSRTRSW